ncbi:MAG: hypothetical protein LKF61_00970 [Eggerthellaceae bacterium]|jgi:hypothetical protein|nr:hypothetical protein [Eggerthellaceae bacterium]MCH4220461.1 hypothetical protein [Eggerthellaceae bacterium]
MVRKDKQQICNSVHEGSDGHAMTCSPEAKESVYWIKHDEFWKSTGNNTVEFTSDCPQRVKDSYKLWKS